MKFMPNLATVLAFIVGMVAFRWLDRVAPKLTNPPSAVGPLF